MSDNIKHWNDPSPLEKSLQAELTRLREENQRLKTQLSGITQHGSVDAAELKRLADANRELVKTVAEYLEMIRTVRYTPSEENHRYLMEIEGRIAALAKHNKGSE